MAAERGRQLMLGGLALVLVFAIVKLWPDARTSTPPASSSNRVTGNAAAARAAQTPRVPGPPDVHLDALNSERPRPETAERNLFRFRQKAPPPLQSLPPGAARPAQPQPAAPVMPSGPPPPPPLSPIALKFIGIVEAPSHGEKIAILSDGRNAPFYGKEGAIIEGRYRILKIGVESVELAYADGRGRQTIRLTGS